MRETFYWWLAVEAVGVAAFPIAFTYFRSLPDRGYGFTKLLGLLILGYGLWMGGLLGLLLNRAGSIVLLLILLSLVSFLLARRQPGEIVAFLKARWRYLLAAEVVFTVSLATFVWIRSFYPDLDWSEKPMNLAFLNGILRSEKIPPNDPWFSGHSISYYYFGHFIVAMLAKLTSTPASIAFNIAMGLVMALAATAIFGLVYNMLVGEGGRQQRAVVFGLVAVLLLLILGNLEGVFELMAVHGIGSDRFYDLVDIHGLDGPWNSDAWYPTGFWWGRATRVAAEWDWREFPIFTFILSDLHAHFIATPFVIMSLGAALNFFRSDHRLDFSFWWSNPSWLLLTGLVFGALGFLHNWDLATFMFVLVVVILLHNYLADKRIWPTAVGRTLAFAAPLGLLATLLFIPFYATFHPVINRIAVIEVTDRGWLPLESMATRPHHFLYLWLPLVWLAASLGLAAGGFWRRWGSPNWLALLPGLVPLGLWALIVLGSRGPVGFGDEVATRGTAWITVAILVFVLTALSFTAIRELTSPRAGEANRSLLFAVAAAGTATLLLLGAELFWVKDPQGERGVTTFKTSYQAWMLFSVAGAFAIHHIWSQKRLSLAALRRWTWTGLTAMILAAGLVYSVTGLLARTNGFTGTQHIDGLAGIRVHYPAQYEALQYLWNDVEGTPVIMEAVGEDYSYYARISAETGLPAVLGWGKHQWRWRGGTHTEQWSWEPARSRREDVTKAYETTSVEEAQAILDKYDVEYVYVGSLEKTDFPPTSLAKFDLFMDVAFKNSDVTIYRRRHEPATSEFAGEGSQTLAGTQAGDSAQ